MIYPFFRSNILKNNRLKLKLKRYNQNNQIVKKWQITNTLK